MCWKRLEVVRLTGSVKPQFRQVVRYLPTDSEEWKTVKIFSRGGKGTGKYADWLT